MNRRQFLQTRHLAQSAAEALGALVDLQPPEPEPVAAALLRFARRAMATTFEVLLPFGTPAALETAEAALDEIDRLEAQLTIYRDSSEVSRLNRYASIGAVPVEPRLFALLEQSAQITQQTESAFDITSGALTKTWGFFKRQGQVPSETDLARAMSLVGMDHVELNPQYRTVRFLRRGLEINLGSIGKGYALDRAVELLRADWNVASALVHGGHSSIYALGSEPGGRRGWTVGVRHPWQTDRRLAVFHLQDMGLATSAATFQYLEYRGRKLGHILDPRTGWPAEGLASASVVAPTAALADALATAFFILGVEKTQAYCEAHPEIGALLVPQGEDARPVLIGLASHVVELLP